MFFYNIIFSFRRPSGTRNRNIIISLETHRKDFLQDQPLLEQIKKAYGNIILGKIFAMF